MNEPGILYQPDKKVMKISSMDFNITHFFLCYMTTFTIFYYEQPHEQPVQYIPQATNKCKSACGNGF